MNIGCNQHAYQHAMGLENLCSQGDQISFTTNLKTNELGLSDLSMVRAIADS